MKSPTIVWLWLWFSLKVARDRCTRGKAGERNFIARTEMCAQLFGFANGGRKGGRRKERKEGEREDCQKAICCVR